MLCLNVSLYKNAKTFVLQFVLGSHTIWLDYIIGKESNAQFDSTVIAFEDTSCF